MKIVLKEIIRSDFDIIRGWIDVRIFTVFKQPIRDSQLESLLTKYINGKPAALGYKAVDMDGGAPVGIIHAAIDWQNELAHIRQIIVGDPKIRRQGIGGEMMRQFLSICFEKNKLHRVQLFVWQKNKSAAGFYKKIGFKTDGLMREAVKYGNGFRSFYCMSVLKNEWKKI